MQSASTSGTEDISFMRKRLYPDGEGDLYRTLREAEERTGRDGHVRPGVQAADSVVQPEDGCGDSTHRSRCPGYYEYYPAGEIRYVQLILYPALVQGEGAAAQHRTGHPHAGCSMAWM